MLYFFFLVVQFAFFNMHISDCDVLWDFDGEWRRENTKPTEVWALWNQLEQSRHRPSALKVNDSMKDWLESANLLQFFGTCATEVQVAKWCLAMCNNDRILCAVLGVYAEALEALADGDERNQHLFAPAVEPDVRERFASVLRQCDH